MRSVNRLAAAAMIGAALLLPAPARAQPGKGTDRALDARIEARMKSSPLLRQDRIDVRVENGVVTLSGKVASAAHSARAAALARVPGVARIDNRLEVDPSLARRGTRRSGADRAGDAPAAGAGARTKEAADAVADSVSDTWIVAKIKADFVHEDLLEGSDIHVDADRRIVTLKGTVPTAAGRARAVQIAKTTKGVAQVVDALTVGAKR